MKCVSVVGIGPGNELYLSIAAKETLEESDLIVGYKKYVELVEEYLPEKEYLYTGMTKEVDKSGRRKCSVCSMQWRCWSVWYGRFGL